MLTKTKIALVAALVAGSASAALAQDFDPNLANRYPSYADPGASAQQSATAPRGFQSAPAQLRQGRNVAPYAGQTESYYNNDPVAVDSSDRASSPYAGGGF